jgi:DNA-binding NarL/FixJ family response regulator
MEVLQEMTEGYVQKEIADRLFISPSTVNTHIQHIYEKLHVHSGIEAVAKALRERLV